MVLGQKDQRDAPVDAAEEGEIGPHGGNALVVGIVHLHLERILAGTDERGDVKDKGRIAALVVSGVLAVHKEVHLLVGAFKAHEDLLSAQLVVQEELPVIPANPSPVAGLVVHGVFRVPGVREGYRLRDAAALLPERPPVVDAPFIPLRRRRGAEQKARKQHTQKAGTRQKHGISQI